MEDKEIAVYRDEAFSLFFTATKCDQVILCYKSAGRIHVSKVPYFIAFLFSNAEYRIRQY